MRPTLVAASSAASQRKIAVVTSKASSSSPKPPIPLLARLAEDHQPRPAEAHCLRRGERPSGLAGLMRDAAGRRGRSEDRDAA